MLVLLVVGDLRCLGRPLLCLRKQEVVVRLLKVGCYSSR